MGAGDDILRRMAEFEATMLNRLDDIDRKVDRLAAHLGADRAAAGTSIMPPTSTASSNLILRSRSWALALSRRTRVWSISWLLASMGIRIFSLP